MEKKYEDLEQRLERFAITGVKVTEKMPSIPAGRYYADQLLRASGSAALNYAESQGGASHRDFSNKLKIVFKELRESHMALRIIQGANLHSEPSWLLTVVNEAKELVAILAASVRTAEQRSARKN
ncbi:MAG: four helix bundle protein [Flavobacteriales bacterium]|nr:four helix bundle protein [Flavobacteriales bacterium]